LWLRQRLGLGARRHGCVGVVEPRRDIDRFVRDESCVVRGHRAYSICGRVARRGGVAGRRVRQAGGGREDRVRRAVRRRIWLRIRLVRVRVLVLVVGITEMVRAVVRQRRGCRRRRRHCVVLAGQRPERA
jgi:hypothetical protein